jgi:fermentation-respiration switch protein FrsA (DUF1100 family)
MNGRKFLSALKVFAGIALGFAGLLILVGFIEAYVLTHPQRIIAPGTTLIEKHIQFQSFDLVTDDGIRLSAWYTPPKNGALIMLTHGYGDNRPEWMYVMFAKAGYGVLAWDARAHGSSGGDISTLGYNEVLDVKAALDFAKTQPEIKRIGAWGDSMGAATIIRAAAEFPQIEALVVDSSYVSLDKEVDFLVPYPLVNPLAKFLLSRKLGVDLNDASPGALIGKISPRAVYLIQGGGDEVAPPDSAEQLYNAAGDPRFLWFEPDVPHVAMYLDNPRKYERRVVGFFDEYLLGR